MEPPDVQKMLDAADFSQSGKLSYPEFVAAAFDKKRLLTEENLRKAFTLFDSEGNGYFERARLEEMFCGKMSKKNLNSQDRVKLASDMIRSFGHSDDERVTFEQFRDHMNQVLKKKAQLYTTERP